MDAETDRALGCMVGLAVGDAMGAPLEFSRRDSLPEVTGYRGGGPFNLGPGDWTDDTACALALAEALLWGKGKLKSHFLLSELNGYVQRGEHVHTGRCFDVGNQTSAAVRAWVSRGSTRNGDEAAQGNGAIMRLAPVALVARTEAEAVELGAAQCAATHASSTCVEDARYLASVLWEEVAGRPANFPGLRGYPRDRVSSSGHTSDTLRAAKWAVANTSCFRDAVLLAVNLGDDSDTVGAVTGQVAGARYGLSGIPRDWRDGLTWGERVTGVAGRLYALRGRE